MQKADYTNLIKRAQQGDAAAFEALVNETYDIMFKIACKWSGNRNDAEDITQDACIKLAQGLKSYKHNAAFTSWLYRLVINTGKDFYRSKNRQPVWSENMEEMPASSSPETDAYTREVLKAVHALPEAEKDALLLVFSEGLSHKEAADILGCKESTVSWRIHEARKKLGAQFEKEQKYG